MELVEWFLTQKDQSFHLPENLWLYDLRCWVEDLYILQFIPIEP